MGTSREGASKLKEPLSDPTRSSSTLACVISSPLTVDAASGNSRKPSSLSAGVTEDVDMRREEELPRLPMKLLSAVPVPTATPLDLDLWSPGTVGGRPFTVSAAAAPSGNRDGRGSGY